ncbi:MAG TPA: hypothetical protein VEK32_11165 [Thermodesulfobacteriota bacterium]|nr:hypothetical protein [Thermodesulfobacteriota bacterium]
MGIGAVTTITEVANDKIIQKRYPALAKGAYHGISPRQEWLSRCNSRVTVWRRRAWSSAVRHPIPWRSREVEEAVTGIRLDNDAISKAAEAAVKKCSTAQAQCL